MKLKYMEIKYESGDNINNDNLFKFNQDINQIYIRDLINLKQHITSEPTFIPKKFIDQIQFYDDGTDQKLYLYINNTWKSITL
jgi:hypothetical protein